MREIHPVLQIQQDCNKIVQKNEDNFNEAIEITDSQEDNDNTAEVFDKDDE